MLLATCFLFAMVSGSPRVWGEPLAKDGARVAADNATHGGRAVPLVESVMAGHPRLLFGPRDVEGLRAFARGPQGKPFMDLLLDYLPSSRVAGKPAFLTDATDGQRQGYWRLPTVAMHYVLTGDKVSLERATAFLEMLLALEHWETGAERDSGMSAGNIMVGAALAYDWLHDDLDPGLREKFRQKLLRQARAMYEGGHLMKNAGTHYWQNDPANNHRWHRNAGLTLAVLAAYSGDPSEREILASTYDELAFVAKWLPEDGSNHEGPGYAIFGNSHLVLAMQAADRCFGSEYLQGPFFKNTGRFVTQTLTPDRQGVFHFGDSGAGGLSSYAFFLYKTAAIHQQPDVYAILDEAVARNAKEFVVTAWMPLIWYDPRLVKAPAKASLRDLPTRALFDDLGLALVRDGWTQDSVAAMFKCGSFGGKSLNDYRNAHGFKYINVAHDDPDANSLTLWKNGGFLAETDRYSKRKQSSHHNTILINGMGQMAAGRPEGGVWSQPAKGRVDMNAMGYITAYKEAGDVVVVEGEALGSYLAASDPKRKISRPDLSRFRRTFIWVEGRYVLVLDDIRAPQPVEITWMMQAPKLDVINAKAQTYRLTGSGTSCALMVVGDKPMTGEVVAGDADHRGENLDWRQLRLNARTATMRFASVFDLWNRGEVSVVLDATDGERARVRVIGPGIDDTWQWQAAANGQSASKLVGRREGTMLIAIDSTDAGR